MTQVLVIEDDSGVAAGIVSGLRDAGFSVVLETNGRDGGKTALRDEHDILLLDLRLPEQSGFEVLKQLEHRSRKPIIVLTAQTELQERLQCFALGAADYVSKPFWMEELVARIRSQLKLKASPRARVWRFSDVVVDLDAFSVEVGGVQAALTKQEFVLLAYLVERPGRALTREQIASDALGAGSDARTVDSHVAHLRKKLGTAGTAIGTVWGIGYRFFAEPLAE